MKATVTVEAARLNAAIVEKQKLRGQTMLETVQREGGKLAFELFKALRSIAPAAGRIRAEQMSRFNAGGGIRISEWVKNRILTKFNVRTSITSRKQVGIVKSLKKQTRVIFGEGLWQSMVEMELNSRESGRGFLAQSARYPQTITGATLAKSRFGGIISAAGLTASTDGATLTFGWDPATGPQGRGAAEGMSREPKAQQAIAKALAATTADIQQYLDRKNDEALRKAGLK